jgi:predicted AAA+ superfamily ATPase
MNYDNIVSISEEILTRKTPSYKRFLFNDLSIHDRLTGLLGPKGTGKTTLMLQFAKECEVDHDNILYVSCDWSNMANVSLLDLAKTFNDEGGKLLLIDEIHYALEFCKHLKEIYEIYPSLTVIYSGSSAINISECKDADLSRRAVDRKVPPLSFREYLSIENEIDIPVYSLDNILKNKKAILRDIKALDIKPQEQMKRYLIVGGFPFYRDSKNEVDFLTKMNGVITYIIDQEIATIFNLSKETTAEIKEILITICGNGMMIYSPIELARRFWGNDSSRRQAADIIDKLIQSGVLFVIKKNTADKLLKSGDQLRIFHPNINYALCRTSSKAIGYEGFLLSHLWRKYNITTEDNIVFNIDNKEKFSFADALGSTKIVYKESSSVKNEIPLWMFGLLY